MLFQSEESLIVEKHLLGNRLGLDILGKHSLPFEKTLIIVLIGLLMEKKVKQRPLYLFV